MSKPIYLKSSTFSFKINAFDANMYSAFDSTTFGEKKIKFIHHDQKKHHFELSAYKI